MALSPEETNEFNVEAYELLDMAEKNLLAMDSGDESSSFPARYDTVFRTFHNLKGAAGMMELNDLQTHMHQLENLWTQFKEKSCVPKEYVDLFLRGVDATRTILKGEKINFSYNVQVTSASIPEPAPKASTSVSEESLAEFFSECEEMLTRMENSLEAMEKTGATAELLDSVYREAHSLKGNSYLLGFKQLGDLAHTLENWLDPVRTNPSACQASQLEILFKGTQVLERVLKSLQKKPNNSSSPQREATAMKTENPATAPALSTPSATNASGTSPSADNSDTSSTIRVPVSLLDNLMTLVGEMVLVRNQVIQYSSKSDDLEFLNLSQRLNVVTGEIQSEMMKTRMQPIGNILSKFNRVTRDLSKELHKKIDINIIGAETELDKTLLEAVKDPLTHIVRNSCDHGIETPAERLAKNKSETGTITMRAYHEGGQVIVEIADDGKGLHRDKILAKAVEKNLVSPDKAAAMSEREVMNLIFAPGFSTAAQVTNVSGRGVGMDVVKSNIDRIGGTVELESQADRGTTIRLKIPLTLAIVPAMIIRAGQDQYAIPQIKLVELVRVEKTSSEHKIEYIQGKPVLRLRGDLLPLLDIKGVLGFENHNSRAAIDGEEVINIVVLNSDSRYFGLIVDEIQDTADIVVKPLSRFLKSIAVYSGATVLGDGSIALILDVAGIASVALQTSAADKAVSGKFRESHGGSKSEEAQEFLLFKLNSATLHALFLGYVHRLEEFKREQVELSGGNRVIRYRGQILPIVSLNEHLGYPAPTSSGPSDIVSVIVTQRGEHFYGIEVNEILDVYSTEENLDTSLINHAAILGNLSTTDGVIVVVDPHECILPIKNKQDSSHENREPFADVADLTQRSVAKSRKNAPKSAISGPVRALFAEDTAFFRKHVTGILERAGYEVFAVKNGEEAISALEKNGPDYFRFILSDIEMPKLNGYQLATEVRKHAQYQNLPLIALTSKANPKDRETGRKAGFDLYLEKLNGDELLTALSELQMRKSA